MIDMVQFAIKKNRYFRQSCLVPALLLTIIVLAGCGREPRSPENLVLVCIDTVRADVFFSKRIDDALSEKLGSAQQYLNASAAAPWTIPSVASTMTGLYPYQHNAGRFQKQMANLDTDIPAALSPSAQTLAEILSENQFRTAAFSAHPWMSGEFGLQQGFSQVRLFKGWRKLTSHLAEWLDEDVRPQRFFAYLHFMEAHDWHQRSQQERDAFLSDVGPELHERLLEDASEAACADESSDICQLNLVYALAVREVRLGINQVLKELEQRDLLKDTLVIVYSDHGEEFWDHKTEDEQRGSPRKIFGFGHGQSLYQELLHVPLLVWHPAIGGSVRQELVSLVDVLPSTLAWLDIEHPTTALPGIRLPAGADSPRKDTDPRVVYASGIAYGAEEIAAREGSLKSVLHYPDMNYEYFDLDQDPEEKHPLQSNQLTMRFDVLTGDYIDMKNESFSTTDPNIDTKTLEQLKSIGYLQGVDSQPESERQQKPREGTGANSGEAGSRGTPE